MAGMARWFPERYAQILRRLVAARLDAGLSQQQAAKAMGVSQQLISRIETGDRHIDPAELEAFADVYAKPVAHFFDKDE